MNILQPRRNLKDITMKMIEEFDGLSRLYLDGDLDVYVSNKDLIDEIDWLPDHHNEYMRIKEVKYEEHYLTVKIETESTNKHDNRKRTKIYKVPYESIILYEGVMEYESDY